MSGHSKWHNIRVKKMASDARKGKVYTKYAKLIEIAAREGGGDPTSNIRLRALIDSAKTESVPSANIERAIKKGTGALKGEAMQEVVYEGYGPGGIAFVIEALTDNKNRTLGHIKTILSKNGGRLAESGAVLWMFRRCGVVRCLIDDSLPARFEDVELLLIEHGAEDIHIDHRLVRIITDMHRWASVRDLLQSKMINVLFAGLAYIPLQTVVTDVATIEKVSSMIDALEEDDDVSEVTTNCS